MQTTFTEYDKTFFVEWVPECQEDEHKLVRFGLNATKRLLFASVVVGQTNTSAQMCIRKRKRPFDTLEQGKVT